MIRAQRRRLFALYAKRSVALVKTRTENNDGADIVLDWWRLLLATKRLAIRLYRDIERRDKRGDMRKFTKPTLEEKKKYVEAIERELARDPTLTKAQAARNAGTTDQNYLRWKKEIAREAVS